MAVLEVSAASWKTDRIWLRVAWLIIEPRGWQKSHRVWWGWLY
jgi:hypothetical protein